MNLELLKRKFKKYSILRESGKIEEAIEGYRSLMADAEKCLFSQIPEMIGVAYRMMDKPKKGIPYAKLSIKWAINAKDKEQEANCRRDLGGIYSSMEQLGKAEKEYEKSLKLLWAENKGRVNGIAGTLSFMAKIAKKKKDFEKAHQLARVAISMTYPSVLEHPDGQDTGQYYLFILHEAEIYQDEGDKKKAGELANQALEGFIKLGQTVRQERAEKIIKELQSLNK